MSIGRSCARRRQLLLGEEHERAEQPDVLAHERRSGCGRAADGQRGRGRGRASVDHAAEQHASRRRRRGGGAGAWCAGCPRPSLRPGCRMAGSAVVTRASTNRRSNPSMTGERRLATATLAAAHVGHRARPTLRRSAGGRLLAVAARLPPAPPGALGRARAADGGGLHARLPRAGARRARPQPGLPPPVRPGQPVGARRRVRGLRHVARGRAGRRLRSSSSASRSGVLVAAAPVGPARRRHRRRHRRRDRRARRSASPPSPGSAASPSACGRSVRSPRRWHRRRATADRVAGRRRAARRRRPAVPARPRPRRRRRPRCSSPGLGAGPAQRRRLALGLAVGVSPYLVHLAMAGPATSSRASSSSRCSTSAAGRRLPLPPSWSYFDGFLQRAGLLIEPPWPLPAPASPGAAHALALLLLAAVVHPASSPACAPPAPRGDRRLLAMAVFAAGLLPQALQRADSTHLAWVSCVPLGFLPAAVAELLAAGAAAGPAPPPWRWPPPCRAPAARPRPPLHLAHLGRLRRPGRRAARRRRRRHRARRPSVPLRPARRRRRRQRAARPTSSGVTEPGDTLFVGTGDLRKTPYSEAFLYYLLPELPRRPATSRWTPGSPTPTTPAWPTSSPPPTS